MKLIQTLATAMAKTKQLDFLALLSIRLYLLPVIYEGAHAKVTGFQGTVEWFATPVAQGGLGMPFPHVMALLATGTEVTGCICLTLGLFTRLISMPMLFLMTIAGMTVHWSHGWAAIAGKATESSLRLDGLMTWLSQNFPGRFNYVTELGDPVVLNNGMEFTITYTIMLLVLFFYGGGRFISADYWISRKLKWPL
jgi:putative oxidoreductase